MKAFSNSNLDFLFATATATMEDNNFKVRLSTARSFITKSSFSNEKYNQR